MPHLGLMLSGWAVALWPPEYLLACPFLSLGRLGLLLFSPFKPNCCTWDLWPHMVSEAWPPCQPKGGARHKAGGREG